MDRLNVPRIGNSFTYSLSHLKTLETEVTKIVNIHSRSSINFQIFSGKTMCISLKNKLAILSTIS